MSDQPDQPNKQSLLGHPLTNVLVGFILTGVVGTVITQYFFDRRQEEQQRAEHAQKRREAVDIFIQQLGENQIRTELLAKALMSRATPEEITKHKDGQIESLIQWRKAKPRLLFLAKELLSQSEYERFHMNLETRLEKGKLVPIRQCLNNAYAEGRDTDRVKQILENCRIDERVKGAINCSDSLINGLHEISAVRTGVRAKIDDARRAELAEQVEKACS